MNERYDSDQDAAEYALDPEEPLTVSELSELASLEESLEVWEGREEVHVMGEQERESFVQIWTDYAREEARRAA